MKPIERRRSILAALFVAPGFILSVRRIRDQIEVAQGAAITTDQVRSDLIWLAQIGMVVAAPQDCAMITEAGQDVVMERTPLPGQD